MSFTLSLIALCFFIRRYRLGEATKGEKVLWSLWAAHYLIVVPLAIYFTADHRLDMRYLKPLDWLVWGTAIQWLVKLDWGRKALLAVLVLLGVYNTIMLTKHLIPGSRRNANYLACEWAVKTIPELEAGEDRASDDSRRFSIHQYTSGKRPRIRPVSKRICYLLEADTPNRAFGKSANMPDYIFDEDRQIRFSPGTAEDYDSVDEFIVGNRRYLLYKRRSNRKEI